MGVVGLTAPWGASYETFGLHLPGFINVARGLVAELSEQAAQPMVVLSHLGLEDFIPSASPRLDRKKPIYGIMGR